RGGTDAGRSLVAAIDELRRLIPLTPSHELHRELEQVVAALTTLPKEIEPRRSNVMAIAERLKRIRADLVMATQPVAETGKLNQSLGEKRTGRLTPPKPAAVVEPISPDSLLTALPGIGQKSIKPYNEGLNIYTVQD